MEKSCENGEGKWQTFRKRVWEARLDLQKKDEKECGFSS